MLTSDIVVDEHEQNITLEDALAAVRQCVPVLDTKSVEIMSARGSVLRRDVLSDIDYPTADISAVDGYCLLASATSRASSEDPSMLPVCGTVTAGDVPSFDLAPGECAQVMTGAILPGGADAVTRAEDVTVRNGGISISGPVSRWSFVRRAGEVAHKGEVVLREGCAVTPAVVGLLAAVATGCVEVSEMPRVGVLSTGDEIVPNEVCPGRGHTRNSNARMLSALAGDLGVPVFDAGISRDSEPEIVRRIEACTDCDVVILTGGTAAGRHDLVAAALQRMGADVVFRGLRMSPGRHMLFARHGKRVYICLPGNPVACFALFYMIARPALLAMMGAGCPVPVPLVAKWAAPGLRKPDIRVFMPGRLLTNSRVEPVRPRGPVDVVGLARADCLVSLPEGTREVEQGQPVDVFMTGGMPWSGE